jgi:regulator of sigma E protease
MLTFLIFLAVLAVLVLSHEFGHFVIARRSGMKVHEFGFGFPPRLVGIRRISYSDGTKRWHVVWGARAIENEIHDTEQQPGTLYSINWLPLGGFVRIKGEEGDHPDDPDSFLQKSFLQRAGVVVAGVVMNIILAWVLLSLGFMLGAPAAGESLSGNADNVQVHVMDVLAGRPAAGAGFKNNDIIVQVGDQANPRLKAVQDYFASHANQAVPVVLERNGQRVEKQVTPQMTDSGRAGIGIAIVEIGSVRYPVHEALWRGARATGSYLQQIFIAFGSLVKGVFTRAPIGDEVSGPVGVAVMTGQAAKLGFAYLLQFTALLSLNLAAFNILPIPALDGGRLLFLILGKIFHKRITLRLEHIVHSVGFLLLLILVAVITMHDLGALLMHY